eukprot:GABV01001420.1.p1 GENE.GABV01001420.1~~GABV01001420.1.p1  ORF type:complete len:189 (-),score=49.57 GABV01001420.1:326-844(-)
MPGAESHAGQIFCCVGALAIADALDQVDTQLLGWWLAERQLPCGGLNGRPEKKEDVCYSWWVLSALAIVDRIQWIDSDALAGFILRSQDETHGGISDRPGNMPDIFILFLVLLGFLCLASVVKAHSNRLTQLLLCLCVLCNDSDCLRRNQKHPLNLCFDRPSGSTSKPRTCA